MREVPASRCGLEDFFVEFESKFLALFPEGGCKCGIATIEDRNGSFVFFFQVVEDRIPVWSSIFGTFFQSRN